MSIREKLEDTEYRLLGRIDAENSVILEDKDNGKRELWVRNNDNPSYTIVIDGCGYEFVRTALLGDLWWANIKPAPGSGPLG